MLFRHRGPQLFVIISSHTLSTPCLLLGLPSQSRSQPSLLTTSDNFTSVNVVENLFRAVVVLVSLLQLALPCRPGRACRVDMSVLSIQFHILRLCTDKILGQVCSRLLCSLGDCALHVCVQLTCLRSVETALRSKGCICLLCWASNLVLSSASAETCWA